MVGLLMLLGTGGCAGDEEASPETTDGGFGRPVEYGRDGGLDAGAAVLDAATLEGGATLRVRFVHGLANLGPLSVCHDADGPTGPSLAVLLREGVTPLRADFAAQSSELELPQLRTGALTLHRAVAETSDPSSLDGGIVADASVSEPCSPDTLEATIPLPIPESWQEPFAVRSMAGDEPTLLPALADRPEVTLLGSGLALDPSGLDQRAALARSAWLSEHPGDEAGATQAAIAERARLEATFGPRALIQAAPLHEGTQTFTLSLFHGIPNLTAADAGAGGDQQAASVRLCIQSGTRVLMTLPQSPAEGVPFRVRVPLGSTFEPRVGYTFRVFVADDLDAEKKDFCSLTGLRPVAEREFTRERFQAGHAYTLALLGVVSAADLCSAGNKSFVRSGCARPASELSPRLELFEDAP